MAERQSEFTHFKRIHVAVGTWNVNGGKQFRTNLLGTAELADWLLDSPGLAGVVEPQGECGRPGKNKAWILGRALPPGGLAFGSSGNAPWSGIPGHVNRLTPSLLQMFGGRCGGRVSKWPPSFLFTCRDRAVLGCDHEHLHAARRAGKAASGDTLLPAARLTFHAAFSQTSRVATGFRSKWPRKDLRVPLKNEIRPSLTPCLLS